MHSEPLANAAPSYTPRGDTSLVVVVDDEDRAAARSFSLLDALRLLSGLPIKRRVLGFALRGRPLDPLAAALQLR